MATFQKSRGWIAAALVIAATTLFLSCNSGSKTAQGGDTTSENEEYKVLDLGTISDTELNYAKKLEAVLNENAKQGWEVRAVLSRTPQRAGDSCVCVILAR